MTLFRALIHLFLFHYFRVFFLFATTHFKFKFNFFISIFTKVSFYKNIEIYEIMTLLHFFPAEVQVVQNYSTLFQKKNGEILVNKGEILTQLNTDQKEMGYIVPRLISLIYCFREKELMFRRHGLHGHERQQRQY